MNYAIFPPEDFLEARLSLPLSKSMSARALIISALTPGAQLPARVAECDDTDALVAALTDTDPGMKTVNVGAAGTTMRFLTAYYAALPGSNVVIDGSERMRRRPIGVLVEALRELGATITYQREEGFPPLHIEGKRLRGGELSVDASISSQYISALLMVAPTMTEGLRLTLTGEVTSRPYILMTLGMMADHGVEGEYYDGTVTVPAATYREPRTSRPIEGDWSAAAAWYEAEALSAGVITIENLKRDSLQGDRVLAEIFERIGVLTDWEPDEGGTELTPSPDAYARLDYDFTECPDLAQYAAVTCAMLGMPFRFTGLHTLAIKETDRIAALHMELARLGVITDTSEPATLSWDGRRVPVSRHPVFATYNDHRMAMSFAPTALYIPGVIIRDAEVVSKSYPEYWDHLQDAGFTLRDVTDEQIAAIEAGQNPFAEQ